MIKKIGVIGAGMMGAEIALCFERAGYETILDDIKLEYAQNGIRKQEAVLDKNIKKGKITEEDKAKTLANVTPTDKYEDMADCDLIIEAALEVYETNDLDGMAKSYTGNYANRNLDYGANQMENLIHKFNVDGVIFHSNRSCKLMDFRTYEVQRRITERTGCPSVIFDGDQTEPRVFSDAQYETRIQALLERMEKNKEAKRRGDVE